MTPKIEIASEEYHKILNLSKDELDFLIDDIRTSVRYIEKEREFKKTSNYLMGRQELP